MGGHLGYEYHGLQPSGKYRYKVKLVTYIDCGPSSEIPYAEYPIKVGVYANNLAFPNADKSVVDSLLLYIEDTTVYTPYLPPGCVIGANTCIIQASYSGWIDLDPSSNGYYLFYERCCRNSAIINLNLMPDGSNGFLAYIPPTNVVNSSPDFLFPPIPFLCINDTTTIINTALDLDGDSLVYSFTTPYAGYGGVSNPLPNLPAPYLSWPVPEVTYVAGFNFTQPFSLYGNATVNTQNGIATYYSMLQGTFVVAVKVEEFRNGLLVSSTIRDLQLLFNNCPNNFAPELIDNLQRDYTIQQDDTLCFPISFKDPENDSVFIEVFGDIFDTAVVNPPGNFTIALIDTNKATGDFCWVPPCDLDTGIYEFYVKSFDNGCPPKEKYEFYSIHVISPDKPFLFGSDSACKQTDSVLYWMMVDDEYVYNWNVINGTVEMNLGDSAVISWGNSDSGWVFVDVYTITGCFIKRDSLEITLIDVPLLTAMPEDTVCRMDTLLLFASGVDPYYWYPESDVINPQQGNVDAIISQSGWYYVAGLPGQLCPPSDSVFINTLDLPDVYATFSDSLICYGDTISLVGFGPENLHWFPENWITYPDSAITQAIPEYSGSILLMGIDSNQCRNFDTLQISMYPAAPIELAGDFQICLGDTAFLSASGGVNYTWSPATYVTPLVGETTLAIIQSDAQVNLQVIDSNGCITDTSFWIIVGSLPEPSFTYDTVDINCIGSWIKFNNTSSGADLFYWSFYGLNSSVEINPIQVFPFGNSYVVELTAANMLGCEATYVDTIHTDSLNYLVGFNHVNVFTPDGNGTNDVLDFSLPSEFLECSKVYVFDRWGLPMFESDGVNFSWDGKLEGKMVPEGVYFWIVEINGVKVQGFVHVFN